MSITRLSPFKSGLSRKRGECDGNPGLIPEPFANDQLDDLPVVFEKAQRDEAILGHGNG